MESLPTLGVFILAVHASLVSAQTNGTTGCQEVFSFTELGQVYEGSCEPLERGCIGLHPVRDDCSSYLRCPPTTVNKCKCPDNLRFNAAIQACDHAYNVNCTCTSPASDDGDSGGDDVIIIVVVIVLLVVLILGAAVGCWYFRCRKKDEKSAAMGDPYYIDPCTSETYDTIDDAKCTVNSQNGVPPSVPDRNIYDNKGPERDATMETDTTLEREPTMVTDATMETDTTLEREPTILTDDAEKDNACEEVVVVGNGDEKRETKVINVDNDVYNDDGSHQPVYYME